MDSKAQHSSNEAAFVVQLAQRNAEYAMSTFDLDGVVGTWNAGAQRITQYPPEEIIGCNYARLFTHEDRLHDLPRAILETARRQGHFEGEGSRVRRDGSILRAFTVTDAIEDDDGRVIGFGEIMRDITQQHAAEETLVDHHRSFRLLVEGLTDQAIFMLDPSGVVTNWNAGAERIKGYKADEIVGRHYGVFYPKEERVAGVPQQNLEMAEREGRFETEARRVRKDGSEFWAHVLIEPLRNARGDLVGFGKITHDITEQHASQHALRESERQFGLVIAGIADCAIFMLDRNGMITSWNAGAERIKGYNADEVIGRHISMFYTEADRQAGLPARILNEALRDGKFEGEGWRVRKDGARFWANVLIDAIRDESGAIVGFAKITRDMTRAHAEAQLADAQKAEMLGQLGGSIAHDFNNLLVIMSGQTMLLKRRLKENLDVQPALDAVQEAARRGADLTRQLAGFSRLQAGVTETILLNDREENLRAILATALRDNMQLTVSLPPDIWPIRVETGELMRALVNLVVNARDAMLPEGGGVSIIAENTQVEPGALGDGHCGDFVVITVSDSGSGIPEHILPRVFDPFFTTKPSDKGTGLGLPQVFSFTRASGGDVQIRSEVGKGTAISLYLPRSTNGAARRSEREKSEPVSCECCCHKHILVVEDHPGVSEVACGFIEYLGHTVRAVPSAEQALDALGGDEKFDLVLSDIVLSGRMDGLAFAREVSKKLPDLPIVLTTGYANAEERAAHEYPVLRKPYQLAELSDAIAGSLSKPEGVEPEANVVPLRSALGSTSIH